MSGAATAIGIAGSAAAAAGAAGATSLGAAAAASLAVSAAGAIMQGHAQAESAKFNAGVAQNNAQIAEQNSQYAGQEGEVNAATKELQTRQGVGNTLTAQAANGISVNSGSAADVRTSEATLGEQDAINIKANAARKAYGYDVEASSDKGQSNLDDYQATQDTNASYISAAGSIGSGFASFQKAGALT